MIIVTLSESKKTVLNHQQPTNHHADQCDAWIQEILIQLDGFSCTGHLVGADFMTE